MPEKEFPDQVQLHHNLYGTASPPSANQTQIPPPVGAAALSMDARAPPVGGPHQGYAGLQLPSAFMAYHSAHLAQAAAAADHQRAQDAYRSLWDPSASAAAAFHPSTSHG